MPMLFNPQPKLTFGALNLVGVATDIATLGYTFEALGDDTDWGNPVPIDEKVISWLQDGAIVARKGYENREITIRVRVRAETSAGLASGESALMLETGKPNLLTWTPPDTLGAPCVFSVVMSNLEHVFDDLDALRLVRIYGLRIQAEPFVRSQTLSTVTQAAPVGTQTITSVDNCSSATNWTETVEPTGGSAVTTAATVNGGVAIRGDATGMSLSVATRLSVTRSSLAINITTTPYIRIDASIAFLRSEFANGTTDLSFKLNGIAAPVVVQTGNVYWFDAGALGITTLATVQVTAYGIGFEGPSPSMVILVQDVSRSNLVGDVGTKRQLLRTLAVAGSARTQASLVVEDASAALGSVLVYTYPSSAGIIPPQMRNAYGIPSGVVTADATTVSGSNTLIDLGSPIEFELPASGVQPGGHLLVARVKFTTGGVKTANWYAYSKQTSATEFGKVSGTTSFTVLANTWTVVTVATINLPTVKVGSAGEVVVGLESTTSGLIDEAWIFNVETGQLTWVECGTAAPSAGGPSNRIWLDAPSVSVPVPQVYVGNASDRSDSYHVNDATVGALKSFGNHEFVPPSMNVFTVTTNSTASSVTLSHFPRFHTHAV